MNTLGALIFAATVMFAAAAAAVTPVNAAQFHPASAVASTR